MKNDWNIAAPITFAVLAVAARGTFAEHIFGVLACVALIVCSLTGGRR